MLHVIQKDISSYLQNYVYDRYISLIIAYHIFWNTQWNDKNTETTLYHKIIWNHMNTTETNLFASTDWAPHACNILAVGCVCLYTCENYQALADVMIFLLLFDRFRLYWHQFWRGPLDSVGRSARYLRKEWKGMEKEPTQKRTSSGEKQICEHL